MSEPIGGDHRTGYRVRIIYSEPGFRRRNQDCPPEYSHLFDLPDAPSREAAVREAMTRWDDCIRHSAVGWQRVIKSVSVES
jgi:hypothetical protein